MKKALLLLTVFGLAMASCGGRDAGKAGDETQALAADTAETVVWNSYVKIAPTQIDGNIIRRLGDEWMLITSGNPQSYNTMTASWGGLGIIWSAPVSFVVVRNTRYTYEFLQKNDLYTLSFFDGGQKEALLFLGTHSGRDGDKVGQTELTPMETPLGCMSFEQATLILECRKIYEDKLDAKSIFDDEIAADYLGTNEYHNLFFGEIVNVWQKQAD